MHVCASACPAISVYLCSLPLRFKERLLRVVFRLSSDEQSSGCFSGLFPLSDLSDLSDLFLRDPVGSTVSSGGAESWPPVFEATEAGDEASLIFTTSNLHHMDSPNGARRLANAISFLINRINSAMLNHNGGHKDSRCAPKTFITIIFISWSKRQRQRWGGGLFQRLLPLTSELAADIKATEARAPLRFYGGRLARWRSILRRSEPSEGINIILKSV